MLHATLKVTAYYRENKEMASMVNRITKNCGKFGEHHKLINMFLILLNFDILTGGAISDM